MRKASVRRQGARFALRPQNQRCGPCSIDPVVYLKMMMVGFFEKPSQRTGP